MNRYIFLDFDGVLNSIRTVVADQKVGNSSSVQRAILLSHEIETGFDPIAVSLIHRLATVTSAKIVISSSWRYTFSLAAVRTMFSSSFDRWENAGELIIGMTPRSDKGRRGTEIDMWLADHAEEPYEYVIIDDSSDMTADQKEKHFVQTDEREGFLYRDYMRCLEVLKYEDIDSEKF